MIAVVTGGSGGLGRAIAERLAESGYEVRDWSLSRGLDASNEDQVERAAAELEGWDVLVNNAAVLIPRRVVDMTAAEWDATLAAGLRTAFLCSRAAFRRMARGGRATRFGRGRCRPSR